jgi:ABC-type Fe3+-siderophore transport system permease subunit
MFVLTIFVLLADRALQRAQQVTRGRGAELERLLGLERGLFTQMYQWRMQRLGNMEIREVIAFVIMLICAIAYMWTWWRNDNMVHKPSFTAPSPSWICSYNKVSFLAGKEQLP